jgi:serine/threonine protein kinase
MSSQPPTEPRTPPTDHPPASADAPTVPPAESTGPDPSASSAPTRMADDLAARLLDHPRYRVLRLLGRGGMGAVYLAEHLFMSRQVALKVVNTSLMDSPAALERFRQEVRAAAQLSHPNIVAAFDADHVGDLHFLVMEYIEGVNLAEHLARVGPLPVAQACQAVEQAALGLQHAHDKGMVHRDIKPHNLMLAKGGVVKILDFGLARFAREHAPPGQPALTGTGVVMGTADYIAPEQTRSSRGIDIRADIYGLGCTLYHLLSGRVPFPDGTLVDKMVRHCLDAPEPLRSLRPEVPPELAAVVDKMMAKDPAQRYQTPAEVAAALHPFGGSRPQPIIPILGDADRVGAAQQSTSPYPAPPVLRPADEGDAPLDVRPSGRTERMPPLPAAPERERSGLAVVLGGFSLVIGLIALFFSLGLGLCCFVFTWLTVPFSIVGMTLGGVGLIVPLSTKRSGIALPIAGMVVNGLALLVVILSHVFGLVLMGAWPPTATSSAPPTRPMKDTKEGPTVKPDVPLGTLDWTTDGEVAVYLTKAELVPLPGEPGQGRRLRLLLTVQNLFVHRDLQFRTWIPEKDGPVQPDGVVLTTKDGKQSAPLAPRPGQPSRPREQSIGPASGLSARLEVDLYFPAPPDGAEPLRLQLPVNHFVGKTGLLQLTIREIKK